MKGPLWTR